MTDTIEKALTPAQWAELHTITPRPGGEVFAVIEDRDEGQLRCGYAAADNEEGWASFPSGSPERHALAALALHEQPFGFTAEDVAALKGICDGYAACGDRGGFTPRVWSVMQRIAALLP